MMVGIMYHGLYVSENSDGTASKEVVGEKRSPRDQKHPVFDAIQSHSTT